MSICLPIIAIIFIVGLLGNLLPDEDKTIETKKPKTKNTAEINFYPNDSASVEILKKAFEFLIEKCPSIRNYANDAVKIDFHYTESNLDYRRSSYGWEKQITIEISLPDDTDICPVEMAGHRLFYFIGRGLRPGIVVNKPQAAILCNIDGELDGDVFIPVEEIHFLK